MHSAELYNHSHSTTYIGKYILDSVSVGMYDHPLMAIREYIQNSADAIDDFCGEPNKGTSSDGLIEITVDGRSKCIRLKDNGAGVPAEKAQSVLHDLGRSEKDPWSHRGFRGIGRLGGLGYCEELKFLTKTQNEKPVSVSTWDCRKLKQLLNENGNLLDAASVIKHITTFTQERWADRDEHFFIVEMNGVQSSRNILLNVPSIKSYLQQVAPVPFHPDFSHGKGIEDVLSKRRIPLYRTYAIRVNGADIYKPYADRINTANGNWEEIKDIELLDLYDDSSGLLGFAWLANLNLEGTINPSTLVDGLRVRSGNILIGDKNLLSRFFREGRFNNYLVGEIYIVDNRLVPNARRDDFEDSELRDEFHNCFIRQIGIPYSRRIRELSKNRSKEKKLQDLDILYQRARRIAERGFVAQLQKQEIIDGLRPVSEDGHDRATRRHIEELLEKVMASEHVLHRQNGRLSKPIFDSYESVFAVVYREICNKCEAETVIDKILEAIFAH